MSGPAHADMPHRPNAAVVTGLVSPARATMLAVLILLAALSEGVGLLLLVPLLGAVAGDRVAGEGVLGRLLGALPGGSALEPLLAAFVVLVALRAVLQLGRTVEAARLERKVVETLRARAVAALLAAEWKVLSRQAQGGSLSLLVNGINRVGFGVGELVALAATVALLGSAFLASLVLSPRVALAALIGGAVVVAAYGAVRRRSHALGEELTHAYAALTGRLGETLGAARLIKSFAASARSAGDLARIDRGLTANMVGYQRLAALAQGLLQVAAAAVLALLVWAAVTRWSLSPLVLLPLIALFARVLPLLTAAQQHWNHWLHARPALAETLRLIATLEAAAEPDAGAVEVARPRQAIALDQVGMNHEGRAAPVLAGVDIVLPVNTTTALVGPSGAGKSTAADVLGGLAAPDAGALTLDGRALSPVERIAWRRQVAYVQQEPVLFNATIRDNLLWAAPDASAERVAAALRDASAQFVLALPQGLDTPVGDLGRQLSGGERQRIVLARALLRDPALLILDEPTSALDAENEAAVAQAVAKMHGRLTILIIGHRGLLTRQAERQVRLERGRVVAPQNEPVR